jgi:glycosyltransferase involved in cell wall biosynthesis
LITGSLPERSALLCEMINSVSLQTVKPSQHLIAVDDGHVVPKLNKLIEIASTDYFVQVDDDDLLYPNHVEVLSDNLVADVVWTWCDVTGRNWDVNQGYQKGALAYGNYIPSNCAIRREAFLAVGGHVQTSGHFDHDLLQRLEAAGCSFHNVPIKTWNYRFGLSKNMSLHV